MPNTNLHENVRPNAQQIPLTYSPVIPKLIAYNPRATATPTNTLNIAFIFNHHLFLIQITTSTSNHMPKATCHEKAKRNNQQRKYRTPNVIPKVIAIIASVMAMANTTATKCTMKSSILFLSIFIYNLPNVWQVFKNLYKITPLIKFMTATLSNHRYYIFIGKCNCTLLIIRRRK